MRSAIALVPTFALALSACGKTDLALPDDLVGKAATCAVVAAADARAATAAQVAAPLPFERQAQIVHYTLLAGSAGDTFLRDNAAAVVAKMQEIQEDVTDGDWKSLVQPCQSAFPEADPARAVELPADPLDAQMGCYVLGQFMARALAAQGNAYETQLLEFGAMGRALDPKVAQTLDRRGIKSEEARQAARDKALAKIARVGSPAKVMDACTARFKPS